MTRKLVDLPTATLEDIVAEMVWLHGIVFGRHRAAMRIEAAVKRQKAIRAELRKRASASGDPLAFEREANEILARLEKTS